MKHHVQRQISFLRTTAIGGIFFLLPLLVVLVLIGQLVQVIYAVAVALLPFLNDYTPFHDTTGYLIVFAIATLVLILACFISGIMARRSIARQFTRLVEKYLLMLFPRYAIFKEQLSGNIGGSISKNRLRPVVVQLEGYARLAFEVERRDHATNQTDPLAVTLYLPGSPDPWSGTVVMVEASRVSPIDAPFGDVVATFEQLGTDTQRWARGESTVAAE
ncbi:DUF502 domain-containing protein [Rhodopirellula sp. JC740]|uniref:DUF502 domain-containing protein n=1 Tax=Rhodopirellula halodulae TaxID=2894198 RepID=A0ABS8NLU0_9BACT|nr:MULTISPECIES: DUF502 domain-containing protein [unclassified Rhodopirellula]MCC9644551.1 DUF502 domain-containing protein [Rhodopirellula sp. JC740]MCC9656605.1 DUF502 domain-containing protein [Rhodopirellula sp. JC737]